MLRVVAYPSVLMVLGFIFLFAGNFTNSSLSHRAMVYVHPEGALTALPIIICGLHSILFSVFQVRRPPWYGTRLDRLAQQSIRVLRNRLSAVDLGPTSRV